MIKYNETLADRVRELLMHLEKVEEKLMFSGLVFMVNDKMCIGVKQHELMLRINPEQEEELVEKNGCTQMVHGKIIMKGYVFVEEEVLQSHRELNYWVKLALDFNPLAKASKRKIKSDK
ncbi:TfoX/Sxy family protein [Pedobacter punctiformis]|uniref:TfoX/Sxy family protein n=1 Tax=Pedobacter punctiformis TaxID=3004097 RepID=A0ABT4L470_9SPHI|nr:TfoX/Sxy family protein [Pedobacter sp. HCMS5-2]MCZ4242720.1 TfoX/Sxy family protein [Pedobacter sp. HCMS5-2]